MMPLEMVMIRCRHCRELLIENVSGQGVLCPRCGTRTPASKVERFRQLLAAIYRAATKRTADPLPPRPMEAEGGRPSRSAQSHTASAFEAR